MTEVSEQPIDLIQAAVDRLLDLGKERGYVTWEEMNEILPDDAIDPSQLEIVMMRLEEAKVETLDEADATRYEQRRKSDSQRRDAGDTGDLEDVGSDDDFEKFEQALE